MALDPSTSSIYVVAGSGSAGLLVKQFVSYSSGCIGGSGNGLGQISLMATAKVPRSTGYLFGPDLMKQREASYQKKGDKKTCVGRLWVRILTPAIQFFSRNLC